MIEKIRQYFIDNNIIDENCRINVDFLGETPTEFSILPMPVNPKIQDGQYIDGSGERQYQFQLISRNDYSADVMQNIANSSYYEHLYNAIEDLNNKKILPQIDDIQSIECLNNGAILNATTNTAQYAIQMKITYFKEF